MRRRMAATAVIATPSGNSYPKTMNWDHINFWIFDLDNTLYPPEAGLFAQIETRMTAWVMRETGLPHDAADRLRADYWRRHGTTLAGLMAERHIDPDAYLAEVHDIDFSVLRPDPALAAAIAALPGRKIVHTNADAAYAAKVLAHRGLPGFDAIWGIAETGYHPKPDQRSYAAILHAEGYDPTRAAMFEDDHRNLSIPHRMGMQTVLIGPGRHGPDALPPDHDHGSDVDFHSHDLTGFLTTLALTGADVAE
ncbi:MAG: pyrimidine 5'-nucleotidase [Paracoccus sp. (in: a-proteobacteria)]|uniref:pyrimidine 5'-nucleotidase n=1 Tax=Paracoccus sp. TaxID=267 RepID=UPI0026DF74E7|nr:pyrimidine 5'-nucleotidase [Paracoccus sp. (in: a-proteobacteria)]MDO5620806.1 pyrimidine 5'-nucleotidase [Paracoccus sp. (in: a-proteobacteria)]